MFSKEISDYSRRTQQAALNIFRGSALTVFSRIIQRTPVGNPELWLYNHPQKGYVNYLAFREAPAGYVGGRLRANWQASLNAPKNGEIKSTDKAGRSTARKAENTTKRADINDVIYLTNNLPYAKSIEDGTSTQAPRGMVKVTIAEWDQVVKRNARKYKPK